MARVGGENNEKTLKGSSKSSFADIWTRPSFRSDFGALLGANWGQFRLPNRAKIDRKIDWGPDALRDGTETVKESFLGALAPVDPAHFDPRGGGRGRGKPLPRGVVIIISSSLTQRGSK